VSQRLGEAPLPERRVRPGAKMPAVSQKQQRLFAIAEHNPSALHAENEGLASLSHKTLHDFAATPRKGLPVTKKPEDEDRKKIQQRYPSYG
jgi:hypothetical protein